AMPISSGPIVAAMSRTARALKSRRQSWRGSFASSSGGCPRQMSQMPQALTSASPRYATAWAWRQARVNAELRTEASRPPPRAPPGAGAGGRRGGLATLPVRPTQHLIALEHPGRLDLGAGLLVGPAHDRDGRGDRHVGGAGRVPKLERLPDPAPPGLGH